MAITNINLLIKDKCVLLACLHILAGNVRWDVIVVFVTRHVVSGSPSFVLQMNDSVFNSGI